VSHHGCPLLLEEGGVRFLEWQRLIATGRRSVCSDGMYHGEVAD
jgi:hypothetical protein